MTSLFGGLAQRGAGIAAQLGAPLLALRPRARYEPISGLPASDAGEVVEAAAAPQMPLPSVGVPIRHDTVGQPAPLPPALGMTRLSPSARTAPPPSPILVPPLPAEPSDPRSPPIEPAYAVAAIAPGPPPQPSPVAAAPAEPPIIPEPLVAGALPYEEAQAEARRNPPATELSGTAADAAAPAPATAIAPASAALLSATTQPELEPLPPQVTIAIERIDIALAPPAPTHRPAAPPAPRTSGFAAYARARRGIPR